MKRRSASMTIVSLDSSRVIMSSPSAHHDRSRNIWVLPVRVIHPAPYIVLVLELALDLLTVAAKSDWDLRKSATESTTRLRRLPLRLRWPIIHRHILRVFRT